MWVLRNRRPWWKFVVDVKFAQTNLMLATVASLSVLETSMSLAAAAAFHLTRSPSRRCFFFVLGKSENWKMWCVSREENRNLVLVSYAVDESGQRRAWQLRTIFLFYFPFRPFFFDCNMFTYETKWRVEGKEKGFICDCTIGVAINKKSLCTWFRCLAVTWILRRFRSKNVH